MREVLCRADWLSIYILHILKIDILRVTIIIKCSKHKITSETKSNALLKSVHAFSRKQQNLICCLPQTITFWSVGLRRKAGRKKEHIYGYIVIGGKWDILTEQWFSNTDTKRSVYVAWFLYDCKCEANLKYLLKDIQPNTQTHEDENPGL